MMKKFVCDEIKNYISSNPLIIRTKINYSVAKFLGGGVSAGFPVQGEITIEFSRFGQEIISIEYMFTVMFSDDDEEEYTIQFDNDYKEFGRLARNEFYLSIQDFEQCIQNITLKERVPVYTTFYAPLGVCVDIEDAEKNVLIIGCTKMPINNENVDEIKKFLKELHDVLKKIYYEAERIKHHRN